MSRNLPSLPYLRAFEATARLGSVTRAADELGRTHGAISKQIQLLQEQLRFPLFEKAGTGLRLNNDGKALFVAVTQALDLIEERYDELRASKNDANVHVACSATFAMVWLVPRLSEFYRLHPNCRVQLSMSSSARINSSATRHGDDVDFALSWDRLSRPQVDQHAIPLAGVSFGLVSAPGYPFRVKDNRMSFPTRISHDQMDQEWSNWQRATGYEIEAQSDIYFSHMHLCAGAAVAGLGVALIEQRLVQNELKSGKLVERSSLLEFKDGFVAYPRRTMSPAATEFLNWLRDTLAQEYS